LFVEDRFSTGCFAWGASKMPRVGDPRSLVFIGLFTVELATLMETDETELYVDYRVVILETREFDNG
jgi:hypothetical protein